MGNLVLYGYGAGGSIVLWGMGISGTEALPPAPKPATRTRITWPEKITFVWDNYVDYSTTVLTPEHESATLPAANLKTKLRSKVWRTHDVPQSGTLTEAIEIDFIEPRYCRFFGLVADNLSTTATITLQMNSTPSWDDPPYEETFNAFELTFGFGEGGFGEWGFGGIYLQAARRVTPPKCYFLDVDVNGNVPLYRYAKITFTDPENNDGWIEIGKIFLANYYESATNYIYGAVHKLVDPSGMEISSGGVDWGNRKNLFNQIELTMPYVTTDAKIGSLMNMLYSVGQTENLILMLDPSTSIGRNFLSFYGRFVGGDFGFVFSAPRRHNLKLIFKEVR